MFRIHSDHGLIKKKESFKTFIRLMKKLDSSECDVLLLKTNGKIYPDQNLLAKPLTTVTSTSSPSSSSSSLNEHKIFQKLLTIVKFLCRKMEQDKLRYANQEIVNIEWKELSRRIELIFLFLSFLAVIITPILLFGKFFLRDFITKEHLKLACGCQHTFVKKN